MFNQIFVEQEFSNHPILDKIKNLSPKATFKPIDRYDNYFGKVKKPYLEKRNNLNLYVARKRGALVKEAPDAYGLEGDPHYYFIHAYNCIYECEYCYLQGYFNSPDIVLFLNHEEIGNEIKNIIKQTPKDQTPWFHAGEFSDSLALTHITDEVAYLYNLFRSQPNAKLEFRTKSVNIRALEKEKASPNNIVSFSLSPSKVSKSFDLKTPSTSARLKAIKKLHELGHPIGIHLDPIIYTENIFEDYKSLMDQLQESIPISQIEYLSIGVVRFTKDVFRQLEQNYPNSSLLAQEFSKSFDSKIRYSKPMRNWILSSVKETCVNSGLDASKIYLCME